jgi:hypothetical protein
VLPKLKVFLIFILKGVVYDGYDDDDDDDDDDNDDDGVVENPS